MFAAGGGGGSGPGGPGGPGIGGPATGGPGGLGAAKGGQAGGPGVQGSAGPSSGKAPGYKSTIFDKLLDGSLPCRKVYEDSSILAFHDINPQAPVHIVLIPKAKKNMDMLENVRSE